MKWGNPSYGMQGASFVSHNGTEWAFEMYAYELRDVAGNYIGWYPYDPNNANIKVTILGKDAKTLYVPEQYSTISSGLSSAASGQTVIVTSGIQSITSSLAVNSGVTLQLNSGATLQFNSSGRLLIYGTLNVNGTNNSHVTLDGQNNARSGITNPMVVVPSGGIANIQFTDFQNAGYGLTLWYNSNTVTVQNCSFTNFGFASDSKALTVYSTTGTTTISNNIFIGSNSQGTGIYSYNTGTNISISGNTISSAGTGIRCYSSNAMLTGNNIQSNYNYGIQADNVSSDGIIYRNNNVRYNAYGVSLNVAHPWVVGNTIAENSRNLFITSSSPYFGIPVYSGNPGAGHNIIAMSGSPLVDIQNYSYPFFGYYSSSAYAGYNSFYGCDLPHMRALNNCGVDAFINESTLKRSIFHLYMSNPA